MPIGSVLQTLRRFVLLIFIPVLLLSSCSLPQVKAEDRLFLDLSLELVGVYQLPKLDFEGTKVGGLSGLTYDRQHNCFYAISDDRSEFAPARFYTLKLDLSPAAGNSTPNATGTPTKSPEPSEPSRNAASPSRQATSGVTIAKVTLEKVTTLKAEGGQPYAVGTIDAEGIALSPRQSLFISSEGDSKKGIAPFIDEFDLATGNWRSRLPIPSRYLPRTEDGKALGVQDNRGFEALTLNAGSYGNRQLEPFRLFSATEAPLQQDLLPQPNSSAESAESTESTSPSASPQSTYVRFLHYLISEERPLLLAEHLYSLDPPPADVANLGLSELLVLDQGGHFLSLERSFGITGFSGKIFQLAIGGATDVSNIPALAGNADGLTPIAKRLLLDLSSLGVPLDNYEGTALGPRLPDGSQSLILVSDDNFNELQTTEFMLLKLRQR
jgi:hypothetical protein